MGRRSRVVHNFLNHIEAIAQNHQGTLGAIHLQLPGIEDVNAYGVWSEPSKASQTNDTITQPCRPPKDFEKIYCIGKTVKISVHGVIALTHAGSTSTRRQTYSQRTENTYPLIVPMATTSAARLADVGCTPDNNSL